MNGWQQIVAISIVCVTATLVAVIIWGEKK